MGTIQLPRDFSEFLKLLNSKRAEYLLIGGYAVNYYGYARSTGDMDLWVRVSPENAARVAGALREFGFAGAAPEMFDSPGRMVRMGVPPLRLEILTSVSGLDFDSSFARREVVEIEGAVVPVVGFDDLKRNKRASARPKDLADLAELE